MAVNLLDLAKAYLTDNVISQVSNTLGESKQKTQNALTSALPVVLSGIIQKASEPGGTGTIMDLVGRLMTPNRAAGELVASPNGMLGQLDGLLTGKQSQFTSLLSMGSSIITSLLAKSGSLPTPLPVITV